MLMSMFPLSYLIITEFFLLSSIEKASQVSKLNMLFESTSHTVASKRVFMTHNHSELWTKQERDGMGDALSSAVLSLSTAPLPPNQN